MVPATGTPRSKFPTGQRRRHAGPTSRRTSAARARCPRCSMPSRNTHRTGNIPPAIEVSAIKIAGRRQRADEQHAEKKRRGQQMRERGERPRPRQGNRTNVVPLMATCSRQWVMPRTTASRDKRAPCRKNSAAMAVTRPRGKRSRRSRGRAAAWRPARRAQRQDETIDPGATGAQDARPVVTDGGHGRAGEAHARRI